MSSRPRRGSAGLRRNPSEAEEEDLDVAMGEELSDEDSEQQGPASRRGRGRPRKGAPWLVQGVHGSSGSALPCRLLPSPRRCRRAAPAAAAGVAFAAPPSENLPAPVAAPVDDDEGDYEPGMDDEEQQEKQEAPRRGRRGSAGGGDMPPPPKRGRRGSAAPTPGGGWGSMPIQLGA